MGVGVSVGSGISVGVPSGNNRDQPQSRRHLPHPLSTQSLSASIQEDMAWGWDLQLREDVQPAISPRREARKVVRISSGLNGKCVAQFYRTNSITKREFVRTVGAAHFS